MCKLISKIFTLFFIVLVVGNSFARTFVYNGSSDDVLIIEEAPSLGKNVHLIEIKGVEHAWAGKVFQVTRAVVAGRERFSFPYTFELSSGVEKRTFTVVVEKGKTLINGSLIKQMEVQLDQAEAETFNHSAEDSKKAVKGALLERFKKSPFTPEVE